MEQQEVIDSPTSWVAEHIERYVESDGQQGHRWSGVHTLLITTRGRTTGRLHRTALIYARGCLRLTRPDRQIPVVILERT